MKNEIILAGGLLITLIAVGSVIFSGEDVGEIYANISDEERRELLSPKQQDEINIVYETDNSSVVSMNTQKKRTASIGKQADEKPLPLGLSTYDAKRNFKISMYDPEQMYKPSEAPKAKKYVTVEGSIDGSKFIMKVPDYFIENPDNVKFRLTNKTTGESKTIPASFLYNLTTANGEAAAHHVVSMSSRNPGNYEYATRPQITPPSFGN